MLFIFLMVLWPNGYAELPCFFYGFRLNLFTLRFVLNLFLPTSESPRNTGLFRGKIKKWEYTHTMRMSKLIGKRIKENPKDAQTASHVYLLRGGYARQVSAGIYSLLPLGKRVIAKIEQIIRDEMNRIGGQEILMPVVLPGELWEESGRLHEIGSELLRFKDRNNKDMLLGMTHEEAVVHIARTEISSYKQLPTMLYQIQTKYRDEARPRAGLIRTREFTMKDAYSFHVSDECLKSFYADVHDAYSKLFKKIGLRDVVSIQSDPGMMGGAISHEFMALAECGEDTIFMSPNGEYKANKDIARTVFPPSEEEPLPLEKIHTPGKKTIEEVAEYLGVSSSQTGKAVFYLDANEKVIFILIRGDIEVNEVKLQNYLKIKELKFANEDQIRSIGAVPGFASPLGISSSDIRILVDFSAKNKSNLVVGANEEDYHYNNFDVCRDLERLKAKIEVVDIATVKEGDPCPVTGKPLVTQRGIEVGNIFRLGKKYCVSMKSTYLDKNGKSEFMTMGCYGIGLGRVMAAVIEQSHDQYGPIWPLSIAPFHLHICALNSNRQEVKQTAERLYKNFRASGVEVLYDDRGEKAGFMFNDADLIGIPFRLVISSKTLAKSEIEFKCRKGNKVEMVPLKDIESYTIDQLKNNQDSG